MLMMAAGRYRLALLVCFGSFLFFSIQGFVFTNFTSTSTLSCLSLFSFHFLVGHADFDGLTSSFICSFPLPLSLLLSLHYVHNPGRLSFPPFLSCSIRLSTSTCTIVLYSSSPPLHVLVDIVLVLPHIRTPVYCTLYCLITTYLLFVDPSPH